MKSWMTYMTAVTTIALIISVDVEIIAQCQTWQEYTKEERMDLENSYIVYRDRLEKKEDYHIIFQHWQKVYEGAAAADGQRSSVYSDGRILYLRKFKEEKNKQKKAEIAKFIFNLREQQKECYPAVELEEIPAELLRFREKK